MTTAIRTMFGLLVAGTAARAEAGSALSFVTEGDQVIISARGAMPKNGQVKTRGMFIDIELAQSAGSEHVLVDDSTFKRMDLTPGATPRLSLLLHRDMKPDQYAAAMRVEVSNDGLRVFTPRDPKKVLGQPGFASQVATDAPKTACPTGVAAAPPVAKTEAAAPPAPRLPVEELGLAPTEDRPIAAAIETPTPPLMPALAVLVLIVGGGITLLLARRRKAGTAAVASMRVLSETVIAPKVKLVLVAVGDREVLLSVGPTGARALGKWRRAETPGQVDAHGDAHITTHTDTHTDAHADQIAAPRTLRSSTTAVRGYANGDLRGHVASAPRASTHDDVRGSSHDDGGRHFAQDGVRAAAQDGTRSHAAPVAPRQVHARTHGYEEPRFVAEAAAADDLPPIEVVEPPDMPVVKPRSRPMVASGAVANSPAVAGILRLRRPVDPSEVASGDPRADEEWAQELLAAMRSQGAA